METPDRNMQSRWIADQATNRQVRTSIAMTKVLIEESMQEFSQQASRHPEGSSERKLALSLREELSEALELITHVQNSLEEQHKARRHISSPPTAHAS